MPRTPKCSWYKKAHSLGWLAQIESADHANIFAVVLMSNGRWLAHCRAVAVFILPVLYVVSALAPQMSI
jgi:hypothetical protein